ncbi:hypothetical protein [Anaerostipes sp.]|uniref:hypothetical protein n=1 Tax=Anaerostipes sp. TaxID=1872530 RepID=UPI0025BA4917|nr:hypothetical protein [Anaerostipes sp.]MBS7006964.1 hypothetical protein [Anaerostipes sp.]
MKVPVELVISIILLCLGAFVMASYNGAALEEAGAREVHETFIGKIENSGFDPEVIKECKKEAAEKGYELSVKDDKLYEHRPKYKVVLTYYLRVKLLGIASRQEIEGYAL